MIEMGSHTHGRSTFLAASCGVGPSVSLSMSAMFQIPTRKQSRGSSRCLLHILLLVQLLFNVDVHLPSQLLPLDMIRFSPISTPVLTSSFVSNGRGPNNIRISSRVITSFFNNSCATFSTSSFFSVNSCVVLECASFTIFRTASSSRCAVASLKGFWKLSPCCSLLPYEIGPMSGFMP